MNETIRNRYSPDVVSPPGETLEETLEAIGMTQAELAERTGRPKKTINEIIQGRTAITPETSLQLERVLGIPASFWNNREQRYRENIARREEEKRLSEQLGALKRFPINDMIKLRWIEKCKNPIDQLKSLIGFFGVASVNQVDDVYGKLEVSFRKPATLESKREPLFAWLRRGEIEAQQIECKPYAANGFREAIRKIRRLTREDPPVFQPQLVNICAEHGVAVVFVPELPGSRVCGVTRWLAPTKALIQLSLRYKSNDHLWFTFFHEAGHIVLHGKKDVFLETDGNSSSKEDEANQFAASQLIARSDWNEFINSGQYLNESALRSFADSIGIAPGIVVGQLQHEKLIAFNQFNHLKVRFAWAD